MKYGKIKNGVVVQVQPYEEDGFVEIPDSIIPGMVEDGNGGFTAPIPTQPQLNDKRVVEINARLISIDFESVRPIRAISNGTAIQADIDKLAALDAEADALRTERATLII